MVLVILCAVVVLTTLPAAAHWNPEEPYKWLQMPDLSPLGMDVRATAPFILADDFECTVTGPLTDIHIWGSWYKDILPFGENPEAVTFILSIHKDIPAGTGGIPYSRPGEVLWYKTFQPGSFTVRVYADNLREGWMNPPSEYEPEGDTICWQYNFLLEPGEFRQTGTLEQPVIYWLDVQAIPQDEKAVFGWKTRDPNPANFGGGHFNGNATWGQGQEPFPGPWYELRYPPGHEFQGQPLDLAFVITGSQQQEPKKDLGDAPDSSNNFGVPMTAYPAGGPPGVQANFPTVFQTGSPPHGPAHWQPRAFAYLGKSVSLEDEADIGPDEDPTNNIIPLTDTPDKDLADDGVTVPFALSHCQPTQFSYTVTVTNTLPQDMYVNVWFDWNRDGDWDDVMECPTGVVADEWAVKNQTIPAGTPPGVLTLLTPNFIPWHPTADPTEIWMRITLSEQRWQQGSMPGYGGSGPASGFQYGETEDYYFVPGIVQEFDWGDAPDPPYPTLSASNGARHMISPLFLGALIDAEPDGLPSVNADGDDLDNLDDEDGVVFSTALAPGCKAKIVVTASMPGLLDAWIDFNRNGTWEPAEQFCIARPLVAGPNVIKFIVPNWALPGVTYARFRLSSAGGLQPFGAAPDGEVEDYKVTIKKHPWIVVKGMAKLVPLGTEVLLEKNIVSIDFGSIWYFQEADRSAGIGVVPTESVGAFKRGDLVSCYGITRLDGCEVVVDEYLAWREGIDVLEPVGQNNRASGGAMFGNQPGVIDDAGGDSSKDADGLNTVGLSVVLWGKVTCAIDIGSNVWDIWLDDGSNLWDGSWCPTNNQQARGVKVRAIVSGLPLPPMPQIGEYWVASGVMRAEPKPTIGCARALWTNYSSTGTPSMRRVDGPTP